MSKKVIAILENRIKEKLINIIEKMGAVPFSAPVLAEVPNIDENEILNEINIWKTKQPDIFIFQTGVGTKIFFDTVIKLNLFNTVIDIMKNARIIVRGPKPEAAFRAFNIKPTNYTKEPYTTKEVIDELLKFDLQDKIVVVQRYGEINLSLHKIIKEKGGIVKEIVTYNWELPANIRPILDFINALKKREIDIVIFTSAAQVKNLFIIAEQYDRINELKENLNKTLIASIGPVCTSALKNYDIRIDIEPKIPKLSYLIESIKEFAV